MRLGARPGPSAVYYSAQGLAPTARPRPVTVCPMQLQTIQGTTLTVGLVARDRVRGGHPEPIVEFRYSGGILCASYYVSDLFNAEGGLCLEGGISSRQDIDSDTLSKCKVYCAILSA